MDKNLETYVKIYDNWLDDDFCNKTISELQNANWEKHTYTNAGESIGRSVNGEREFDITNNCISSISSREVIMQRIWDAYQKYLIDFNFKWFGTWSGFTEVRFNRYTVDTLMSLHCDHININSNVPGGKGYPTMTALGLLNDDYDGGEFEMFDGDIVDFKKGSIIVFPSNFLYPHLVKPVTRGIRYSYVAWAW